MIIDGGDPRKNHISTVSAIKSVADALSAFSANVQNTTKKDYVQLKVCFERFREIPAATSKIPELLPVPQSHFNAILEMNRAIFRTQFYYNALMSIPPTKLFDGTARHDEWSNEYQNLLNSTRLKIGYICENKHRVEECEDDFNRLNRKYQALCEQYVFYQRLVEAQKKQSRGFSDSKDTKDEYVSGGIKTYSQSLFVLRDYDEYADAYHTNVRTTKGAEVLTYHTWTITGDQSSTNWRYVWFETGCHDTNKSKGQDQLYPTIGRKKLRWYFEGGTWRRVDTHESG